MSTQNILITGAHSLLGEQLKLHLTQQRLILTSNSNQKAYLHMDVTKFKDLHDLIDNKLPNIIIHLAAQSDIDFCQKHPQLASKVNIDGTTNLINAIKQVNPKIHLIFLSSSMVFCGQNAPYSESDLPHPVNVYGQTKSAAEKLIQASGLSYTIIRSSTMFGMPPANARDNDFTRYTRELQRNQSLQLVNDRFYNPISASFVAKVIKHIIEAKLLGILHIGGKDRVNRYQFVQKLARLLNLPHPPTLIAVPTQNFFQLAPRPFDCALKTSLLVSQFALKIPSLKNELENLIQA